MILISKIVKKKMDNKTKKNNSKDEISNDDNSIDEDSSIITKINNCELSDKNSIFEDDREIITGKIKRGFYNRTFFIKLYGN